VLGSPVGGAGTRKRRERPTISIGIHGLNPRSERLWLWNGSRCGITIRTAIIIAKNIVCAIGQITIGTIGAHKSPFIREDYGGLVCVLERSIEAVFNH
jgi:hypothetical protein